MRGCAGPEPVQVSLSPLDAHLARAVPGSICPHQPRPTAHGAVFHELTSSLGIDVQIDKFEAVRALHQRGIHGRHATLG